jgi:hypothetical protein
MLAAQLLDSGQSERLVKANVNLVIWFPAGVLAPDLADALDAIARVRRLKAVPGGTIQSILPGIDYVFMRAGGGSVNDVIAQRRPFVCVREPGQSQIEAILAECLRAGTTLPAVEPRTFAQDPLGVVLEQVTLLEGNRTRLLSSMRRIPGRGEQPLAQMIFKGLSSPNDLSAGHRLTSAPAKSDPGSRA